MRLRRTGAVGRYVDVVVRRGPIRCVLVNHLLDPEDVFDVLRSEALEVERRGGFLGEEPSHLFLVPRCVEEDRTFLPRRRVDERLPTRLRPELHVDALGREPNPLRVLLPPVFHRDERRRLSSAHARPSAGLLAGTIRSTVARDFVRDVRCLEE